MVEVREPQNDNDNIMQAANQASKGSRSPGAGSQEARSNPWLK